MSSQTTANQSSTGYAISDLAIVLFGIAVTLTIILLDGPAVVRGLLGVVSVLVLPGYALTAALFPAESTRLSADDSEATVQSTQQGITLIERAVLSIGVSLAVVALSGIGLNRLLDGIPGETLLSGVVAITVVSVVIASVRRRRVPTKDRYAPSISLSAARVRMASRPDALVIVLVVSVLFAGGAVAYGELGGDQSGLTELYFVTDSNETDSNESYVTTFTRGTAQPVSIAVSNSEGEAMTYTVIGELQRVDQRNGTVVVEERTELSRDRLRVGDGETQQFNTTVEPNVTAGKYRLVYLLYRGDPPQDPQISTAYREVHLWIDVTELTPIGGSENV